MTRRRCRLNLHFNHSCTKVNFAAKTIAFQHTAQASEVIDTSLSANYDLLIGSDGARSVVRSHFLNTELFEFEQKYVPADCKSLILSCSNQPSDTHLNPNSIHSWSSNDGTVVLLYYQLDGWMSDIIWFHHTIINMIPSWLDFIIVQSQCLSSLLPQAFKASPIRIPVSRWKATLLLSVFISRQL